MKNAGFYWEILVKILSLIFVVVGYGVIKNSPKSGFSSLSAYISDARLNIDSSTYSEMLRAHTQVYQYIGVLLFGIGLIFLLKPIRKYLQ